MGLLDITDFKLRDLYHRAYHEANEGPVDTRKYPYLDRAISIYAREHGCTYDDALIFAKTGRKVGRLK